MGTNGIAEMIEDNYPAAVLTVALSTTSERIGGIDFDALPANKRWRFLVLCQEDSADAAAGTAAAIEGSRSDVAFCYLAGRGVAASRNRALALCETELLLFTDDDVGLHEAGMLELVAAFKHDPGLDLLAGKTVLDTGKTEKRYPRGPEPLTVYNCARIGTVELAVRLSRVRAKCIGFDPAFGAGTENFIGDEYIFVVDCLRAGLRGAYRPIILAVHRGPSSGVEFAGHAAARARARVFERVFHPAVAPLIKLTFLWRHRARFRSLKEFWRFARSFLRREAT